MTNKTKIILFVFIGLSILTLIGYGVFSSRKLDEHKEKNVQSNINKYIYDETRDTLDPEAEDDLDDEEAIVEDDDFEVYEEDGGWEEEETSENKSSKPIGDGELEELYDNKPKPKPTETKIVTKPKIDTKPEKTITPDNPMPSTSGNFLVVVGSFKSKRNAGKKMKQLEKAGIKGEIRQFNNSKIYSVVAGRFTTEADAEILIEELKKEHGLKAFAKEME